MVMNENLKIQLLLLFSVACLVVANLWNHGIATLATPFNNIIFIFSWFVISIYFFDTNFKTLMDIYYGKKKIQMKLLLEVCLIFFMAIVLIIGILTGIL